MVIVDYARDRIQRRSQRDRPQIIVQVGHCSTASRSNGASGRYPEAVWRTRLDHCVRLRRRVLCHAHRSGAVPKWRLHPARTSRFERPETCGHGAAFGVARRSVERGQVHRIAAPRHSRWMRLPKRRLNRRLSLARMAATPLLSRALQSDPNDVINQVKDSRLRGRGGAYFPAGLKWESARSFSADRRYLIVNCEEGEPGLFKDRHLMEGAPHRLIEGACIGCLLLRHPGCDLLHQRRGQPIRPASGECNPSRH